MEIRAQKHKIRQQMRQQLASEKPAKEYSGHICTQIRLSSVFQSAKTIALYFPHQEEPNLLSLSKEADKVYSLPRFDPQSGLYQMHLLPPSGLSALTAGPYGIPEPPNCSAPISAKDIDLWLIPGLAFDYQGRRLGRGKGFYDRLLKESPGQKVGCGYHFQILQNLPVEEHDIRLNAVVCEKKFITT